MENVLRSSGVKNIFFPQRNFNFLFILSITFNAIDSPDNDVPNTHPRDVSCACYFIFISLYLTFSLRIFLSLRLLAKRIDLFLPLPKSILNLLSTKHSQIFSKFSFSFFNFCNVFMLIHKK